MKKKNRNSFGNPQKSFHNSPTRITEAFNHSPNSTIAFTKSFTASHIFFFWGMLLLNLKCQKILERCGNSFVDYRINYQKLCYLMMQITKKMN